MQNKREQRLKGAAPFLQLDGVALKTAEGVAFSGAHWIWKRGEQWAVIGPNGSGASLFARALAGHVPVVEGELSYGFAPPPGRAYEDAIALVSFDQAQEIGLDGPPSSRWFSLEHLDMPSVQEFLSRERIEEINPFEVGGPPRRSPRVFAREQKRILKLLKLESLLDRDMLALSNGERRKVLIARALLKNPKLLILDEPFSGLDVESRKHFSQVMTELMRGGNLHVLLVTMRPDELPSGITHELHVDQCRVVWRGARIERAPSVLSRGDTRERRRPRQVSRPATTFTPVIELSAVTVSYGDKAILSDFSWRVGHGESWAILGPNGSGKSTLLSLITGDNPQAYSNDVFVFGKRRGEEGSLWELRRRIGVVSPDELLSGDGNLFCEALVCPGWDDPDLDAPTRQQRQLARHWLKVLGLGRLARELFGNLSLGEQQLMLLARALAKEPDILVLDEPCQGLDVVHRRRFIGAVEDVMKRSDLTVLYVTHHRDEIPRRISHTLNLPRAIRTRR